MGKIYFRFYKFNTNNTYCHHSLRLFGVSFWAFYYDKGFGLFRLFGKGLKWKNTEKHELTFSERNGYEKFVQIGNWLISFLP